MPTSTSISNEQLKEYIIFRSKLAFKKGEFETQEIAYKTLTEQYKQYAINDNKETRELWIDDYINCYETEKTEMEHFEKKEAKIEDKDHYNYKISYDVYSAKEEDFPEGVVKSLYEAGSLLIAGESNFGKSHLAAAVLRMHIKNKPNIKAEVFYEDEFHEITYENSLKETKRLKGLDMLVMDDLGGIGVGQDKRELIKGIIYFFMREAKPIIICSNSKVVDVYDKRTASKIIGSCTLVEKETSTGTRKKQVIKI